MIGLWQMAAAALGAAALLGVNPASVPQISAGNSTLNCQFPTVIAYQGGGTRCSGTLIHPQVFVTAAHCLLEGSPTQIRLGEHYYPAGIRRSIAQCTPNPAYASSRRAADDFAVCVLVEPMLGLPVVPLLRGCETEALVEGRDVVAVGFGITETSGFGTKRYVFTSLAGDLAADGNVTVGDASASGCLGDSGGPAFIQLDDGTWRTLGVLSEGPGCGKGPSMHHVLAGELDWLEQQSGFDLTPCIDRDNGAALECSGIASDPRGDEDSDWADDCAAAMVQPMPAACEAAMSSTGAPEPESDTDSEGPPTGSSSSASSALVATPGGCGCGTGPGPGWALLVSGLFYLRYRQHSKIRAPVRSK